MGTPPYSTCAQAPCSRGEAPDGTGACAPCPSGYWSTGSVCTPHTTCPEIQTGQSRKMVVGTDMIDNVCCGSCASHEREDQACYAGHSDPAQRTDTVCSSCPAGQWMHNGGTKWGTCMPCHWCDQNPNGHPYYQVSACTATADTVCGTRHTVWDTGVPSWTPPPTPVMGCANTVGGMEQYRDSSGNCQLCDTCHPVLNSAGEDEKRFAITQACGRD